MLPLNGLGQIRQTRNVVDGTLHSETDYATLRRRAVHIHSHARPLSIHGSTTDRIIGYILDNRQKFYATFRDSPKNSRPLFLVTENFTGIFCCLKDHNYHELLFRISKSR